MILTDLPYGTMNGAGLDGWENNKVDWDIAIEPKRIYEIANRILRKNGKMTLFSQEPYTSRLITEAIPNIPFNYRMIWKKDHFANSLIAKKAPVNYFEDILVYSKLHGYGDNDDYRKYINQERKKAGFTLDRMCAFLGLNDKGHGGIAYHWCSSNQPQIIPRKHYLKLQDKTNYFKMDYSELYKMYKEAHINYQSIFNLWEGKKYKSNILKYKKDYEGLHPTQKPILLLENLIKTFSNEGDLVVDLTAGSGSTAVACINTKRNYIIIEKEEKYYEIANNRIKAIPELLF